VVHALSLDTFILVLFRPSCVAEPPHLAQLKSGTCALHGQKITCRLNVPLLSA